MPLSQLKVTYEAIQNLVPYARNARTHSKRQIRQIAASIGAFASPIRFWLTARK